MEQKESTKKHFYLIGCGLLALLIFLGGFLTVAFWITYTVIKTTPENEEGFFEKRKKRTAETDGKVTDFYENKAGKYTLRYVTYEFVVNGKSYSDESSADWASPSSKGSQGKVCYEPANLENSFFHPNKNQICGQ